MGERPTHPELLDWLATEFVRSGWSMKHMHRLIMTSAAYQQSSDFRKDAAEVDPGNRLLWAFPRHRLEGEVIRDSSLQVSGLLNTKVGGPSVYPRAARRHARAARRLEAVERRRAQSPQRVHLRPAQLALPHAGSVRHAGHARILLAPRRHHHRAAGPDHAERQGRARMGAGLRRPRAGRPRTRWIAPSAWPIPGRRTPWEKDTVATFFHKQKSVIAERARQRREARAARRPCPTGSSRRYAAAFVDFCQMLLNSNEFVYRN